MQIIYISDSEFYLLLFNDFLCLAGIPHLLPGNSRCGDLFRVYDFVRFLCFLTVSGHIERIQSWNRCDGPFRKRRARPPTISSQFHTHKESGLSESVRFADRSLVPFVWRYSFSGRPGTTGMERESRRGTNRLDWTTKSTLAAIGSNVVVATLDYSRLPVRERTQRFVPTSI